jgi:hypothetical protein
MPKTPRYVVTVGMRDPFEVAQDEESQRALWALIEQDSGIEKIAAQNLLDTGKMLVTGNLIVIREDLFGRDSNADPP